MERNLCHDRLISTHHNIQKQLMDVCDINHMPLATVLMAMHCGIVGT
jgi:hypothetical protein